MRSGSGTKKGEPLKLLSNILCITGITLFFLGFTYGFWICGDYPDTICDILLLSGLAISGLGAWMEPQEKQNSRSGKKRTQKAA